MMYLYVISLASFGYITSEYVHVKLLVDAVVLNKEFDSTVLK